ncbi:hypothetical protein NQZ79_g7158 [Umbelopsis isabellina]|nr:hypothetical protein NQZ79_g7158 [Umbelopsis isabellina]
MAKLQSLHETGITRLSLGVQSLCEDDLPILGRDHSAADAIRAIDIAKRIFGDRGFTFDMIFGRPGQSYKDWSKEIDQALSIAGDHISIYQLTLERGTPLFRDVMAGKVASIADTEEIEDMYEHTIEKTASLGFCHYEVSNYAKTRNAISRHNFSYWRGMDYIGIGPGAHGRLTDVHGNRLRTFGEFHPERWMAQCETEGDGHSVRKMIPMQAHQIPEELVLFGLRTKLGIPRSRFAQMTNNSQLDSILESHSLQSYIDLGLLVDDPAGQCYAKHDIPLYVPHDCVEELAQGAIRPTEKGLAVIDSIIPKILQIV